MSSADLLRFYEELINIFCFTEHSTFQLLVLTTHTTTTPTVNVKIIVGKNAGKKKCFEIC